MSDSPLADLPVAVTGSTGFIGGALARRLLADGARVRALGRGLERAADLAEQGADLVHFDLLDPGTFAEAVAGAKVFFHVAAWLDGGQSDEAKAKAINIDATRTLAEAAAAAGVERFVLVSTVAAYGLPARDRVTEDLPLDLEQDNTYGRTKAKGEVALREVAQATGLDIAICRPGMVYGPGSKSWTGLMLKLVKRGIPAVFGRGDGNAFPVYIDNMVDGLVAAGTAPGASGEAFHFVDEPVSWARFLRYYGDMCGRAPRRVPLWVAKGIATAAELLPLGLPLDRERIALVQRPFVFDRTKTERLLGWTPQVGLDEGMARSEAWLREVGRL